MKGPGDAAASECLQRHASDVGSEDALAFLDGAASSSAIWHMGSRRRT